MKIYDCDSHCDCKTIVIFTYNLLLLVVPTLLSCDNWIMEINFKWFYLPSLTHLSPLPHISIHMSIYLSLYFYPGIYLPIMFILIYRVFRKNCVFSQFTATPPSPTSLRDLQSSQRNASVQSLLLAGKGGGRERRLLDTLTGGPAMGSNFWASFLKFFVGTFSINSYP